MNKTNLELEKKKLDLKKLETSKLELEYKILERKADIDRIRLSVEKQEIAIQEIKEQLLTMESE